MNTYYKAVRPDGGSFSNPDFKWATEPGGITTHPAPIFGETHAAHYLSVATVATDCTSMAWPCRLLEVEPVGETWVPDAEGLPNKVAGSAFRTVRELPAHEVFGPYGVEVVAIIDRAGRLTPEERDAFAARATAWDAARGSARGAARYAARDAAWGAARYAAWDAARYAARYAAWDAAADAALAWTVKDKITDEQFATLAEAWNAVATARGEGTK